MTWFCVRALRRCDGKPQRIANHDVTVSVSGVAENDIEIDKDEGWCHYNFTFPASCGWQRVVVRKHGEVVLERDVLFKDVQKSGLLSTLQDVKAKPESKPSGYSKRKGIQAACATHDHVGVPLSWNSKGKGGLSAGELASAHLSCGQAQAGYGDLTKFRQWAAAGDWHLFGPKHNHYDWWMFPIHTRASKPQYAVGTGEVADLRADAEFMARYREGVELMLLSWGWDLPAGSWCNPRHPCQGWRNWSVRLAKVAQSLVVFGETELFNQVREFLIALIAEKHAGGLALTEEGHTLPGKAIKIQAQFGIDPHVILQVPE